MESTTKEAKSLSLKSAHWSRRVQWLSSNFHISAHFAIQFNSIQKFKKLKNPKIQKPKNPKIQKSENSKTQKSKNPKIEKPKNLKTQKSKNYAISHCESRNKIESHQSWCGNK